MANQQTYARGKSFWHTYIKGRPHIPDTLFERLYDYHVSNGGKFDDINDVGAGLGNLSVRLAERFSRVIITEPSKRTLQDAETFVREVADDFSQFNFVNAAAEDDVLAPASVDAIFTCNALHWIDCEKAIPLFAKQLNSGGTLFAACVGAPILTNTAAQKIWQRMWDKFLPQVVEKIGEDEWLGATQKQNSGYDAVAVPGEYFEPGAIRLRLNVSEDMHEFDSSPGLSNRVDPVTRIGEEDEVKHQRDESMFFQTDLDGLKEIFSAYLSDPNQEEAKRLWQEMSAVLGDGETTAFHPVSIIMATRR